MLTAQRNGCFSYHSLPYHSVSGIALGPEISVTSKRWQSTAQNIWALLSWGTEEMPHEDIYPPPVHGINFKQDARLKSK